MLIVCLVKRAKHQGLEISFISIAQVKRKKKLLEFD